MSRNLMVLLLVGCGWAGQAAAQPAQVIVIRHAEKPTGDNEPACKDYPSGPGDLSLKGWQRAAALVPYFRCTPQVTRYGTPAAVYAQGAKPNHPDSSRRPVETVQGLADALKLKVLDQYTHDEWPAMVKEVLGNESYKGKMVLICWEHKVIPDIAKALGAQDAPKEWAGAVFDRTWVITYDKKKPDFQDLYQELMYGDSSSKKK